MAFTDLPIFKALKSKMHWHQQRQGVLAENVANADTPDYRAKEVSDFKFRDHIGAQEFGVQTMATRKGHIAGKMSGSLGGQVMEDDTFEITPSGNNVILEEQMMKVTQNQMDFQMASMIYSRGLGLVRIALSKSA